VQETILAAGTRVEVPDRGNGLAEHPERPAILLLVQVADYMLGELGHQ